MKKSIKEIVEIQENGRIIFDGETIGVLIPKDGLFEELNKGKRAVCSFSGKNKDFGEYLNGQSVIRLIKKKTGEVIFESRKDATSVLNDLITLIDKYGEVSLCDFKDLCGIGGDFTDNKYGWKDLSEACIKRVREGFIIDMPKTILMEV